MAETHTVMSAVAKRLVFRVPATAEGDDRAACESKGGAAGVHNLKFALDTDGAVAEGSNLGWHIGDSFGRSSTLDPPYYATASSQVLEWDVRQKLFAAGGIGLCNRIICGRHGSHMIIFVPNTWTGGFSKRAGTDQKDYHRDERIQF
jgi:hypothetical protein